MNPASLYKKFLFILAILLLLSPLIQERFPMKFIEKIPPLKGYFPPVDSPVVNQKALLNESYQKNFDKYYKQNMEIRPLLYRLNSQLNYSLFRKSSSNKIDIGKDDYLFERIYIEAYLGIDRIEQVEMQKHFLKIQYGVQELKRLHGVDFLFVIAPNKAYFMPNKIPSFFNVKAKRDTINYDLVLNGLQEKNINHIDFNAYFKAIKEETPYELYPKFGTHWSLYGGQVIATDSIVQRVAKFRNIELPKLEHANPKLSTKVQYTDSDIQDALNLLYPEESPEMLYHNHKVSITDSAKQQRPNVLIIADSYNWTIWQSQIPHKLFKKDEAEFWYYFKESWNTARTKSGTSLNNFDRKEAMINRDAIVLISTDIHFHTPGFGFFQYLYETFGGLQGSFTKMDSLLVQEIAEADRLGYELQQSGSRKRLLHKSELELDSNSKFLLEFDYQSPLALELQIKLDNKVVLSDTLQAETLRNYQYLIPATNENRQAKISFFSGSASGKSSYLYNLKLQENP